MRTLLVEVIGGSLHEGNGNANEQDNVMHVRYSTWFIYLPSRANQQHKMTKLNVDWRIYGCVLDFVLR